MTKAPPSKPILSPLQKRIEVERLAAPEAAALPAYLQIGASVESPVDPSVIQHIEELLEEIENSEQRLQMPQNSDENIGSALKKIADIERKLKKFEAESAALRRLLERLN